MYSDRYLELRHNSYEISLYFKIVLIGNKYSIYKDKTNNNFSKSFSQYASSVPLNMHIVKSFY